MKLSHTFLFLSVCLIVFVSCDKLGPLEPADNEILDGPLEGLNAEEQAQFLAGDIAFNDEIFTSTNGLGPIFVGTSCGGCHAGDGKGHPFIAFKRFGQSDTTGNQFLDQGGPQLQHKALPGFLPEQIPAGASFTTLLAPAVTGLGFLDAVPDADLIALADPDDADSDGISGRPHWNTIPDFVQTRPGTISQGNKYISRFGKKGAAYDLLHQTVGAYSEDIGITSVFAPIDVYSGLEIDPEISTQNIHDVVAYLKTLKAPIPRQENDQDVLAGKMIFSNIKCASCHTPTMTSGPSDIEALSNKEFHPYTDLLLHDMGPGLDDGYTEGYALTSEWKTPPLWGLGLSENSQGGSVFLMHDGRAQSIEEAILLHGGEAENSKNNYTQLSSSERQQLLKFLRSL
jgi:CxxC motif-containing protein (DUF1111 family)